MPLRNLFNYFMQNTQMIEKLANSYPIRRAAQLTIYVFHRTKTILEDSSLKGKLEGAGKTSFDESAKKAVQFKNRFTTELKKEWAKARGKGPGTKWW